MVATMERGVVYGNEYFAGTMDQAARMVVDRATSGLGGYGTLTGAHGMTGAPSNPEWNDALGQAWCNFPDGAPVAWRLRREGWTHARRIPGPDLMPRVIRLGRAAGLRHFLFGSLPEVLEGLESRLAQLCPGAEICGSLSPPFRVFTAEDDTEVSRAVSAARPDIIWVGLGAPKQDIWMRRRATDFPGTLCLGVGAAFDFISGNKARAPLWMQRSGLEWTHRMANEPRALVPRYSVVTSRLVKLMAADIASQQRRRTPGAM